MAVRRFTLACENCCRGWQDTFPTGICSKCGRTVHARASYLLVDLAGPR